MKKIVLAMLLVAAVTAVAQTAPAPAQPAPQQTPTPSPAAPQKKEIKDPAEYNAYVGAVQQQDKDRAQYGKDKLSGFVTAIPFQPIASHPRQQRPGDSEQHRQN